MRKENPTLWALKELFGVDATLRDAPWQRRVDAGDIKAIRQAGEDARKINNLAKKYLEDKKLKRPIVEKPDPIER